MNSFNTFFQETMDRFLHVNSDRRPSQTILRGGRDTQGVRQEYDVSTTDGKMKFVHSLVVPVFSRCQGNPREMVRILKDEYDIRYENLDTEIQKLILRGI